MLQLKSRPKEIEYYIQQVEMLAMNGDEMEKIEKIMALKDLISDLSVKELIAEDLKDENWLEATNILIHTCNKRLVKSSVLQEHIKQCKNFMVFRYIEDKLLYAKEVVISQAPWDFKEIDPSGNSSQWVNSKFIKSFEDSDVPAVLGEMFKEDLLTINNEWLYKNKDKIYSQDIFEDIDFLIKKKRKSS